MFNLEPDIDPLRSMTQTMSTGVRDSCDSDRVGA